EIGSAEKSSTAYFTLTTYMGGEIDNDALCPVSFESGIRDVHYYPDDFSKQGDKPRNMIRSFFSDNFDFVKRIEEKNGTVIYMYGYGRTVVIAHNNGVLEFKREDDERAGSQARYADALEKASSFIAAHGAFESIDGINLTPYIKEVVPDPEGKKGFRFVFGVEINGSRVYYQSGEPVIIDVTGGRVSYYKRDLVNVFSNELGAAGGDYREAFSAINLLAGNLEYVKGALEETKQAGAGEISSIEGLVERVSRFDCGYLRSAENTGSLEAAWVVTIGGLEFYFGLDDGKPLGYRPIFVAGDSPR
ncbi:MAG: hypothetical protein FWG53_04960, partial [Clostridiales bacterium]|nr:hypothetical protein [Clostridiales bacterium]